MKYENVYLKCKGLSVKQIDNFLHKVYASGIRWISDNQYQSIENLEEIEFNELEYLFITNLIRKQQTIFYRHNDSINTDINFSNLKEIKLNNIKSKLKMIKTITPQQFIEGGYFKSKGKAESVDSICIQELAYLPIGKKLLLTINNESYCYHEVPYKIYTQLNLSVSKGKYFNKKIKGQFEYVKL